MLSLRGAVRFASSRLFHVTRIANAEPSITSPSQKKRQRPSRVSDLYDTLVYETPAPPGQSPVSWRRVMAVDASGAPLSPPVSEALRLRLQACREEGRGADAMRALDEVSCEGVVPSARAVTMAVEACLRGRDLAGAEAALERLGAAGGSTLGVPVRALVGVAYAVRGDFEDALRVVRFEGLAEVRVKKKGAVERAVNGAELGDDPVAWGVVVKCMTKLGMADVGLEVMEMGLGRGVRLTDPLLHLTIDAMRSLRRWREADGLFRGAVAKGVQVSERTIASMLLALTHRSAVRTIPLGRVEELVAMVPEPTPRFMGTALSVLTSIGSLGKAEGIFERLREENGGAEEHEYMSMMAGYANFVQVGAVDVGKEADMLATYKTVSDKADATWRAYLAEYRLREPPTTAIKARSNMLMRYVRVKSRCFRPVEAVDILEEVIAHAEDYPYFMLNASHFATVLGSIELACDTALMRRVEAGMAAVGVRHDMRTLAFCLGTCVGDGDLVTGLALVREHLPGLLGGDQREEFRDYHVDLVLRRVEMLRDALKESKVGVVRDLADFVVELKTLKRELAATKEMGVETREGSARRGGAQRGRSQIGGWRSDAL